MLCYVICSVTVLFCYIRLYIYIKCSMFSGYVMNVVLFALLCYDVLCLLYAVLVL